MNISKSKVKCYMNCPLHFKYKYVFGLPEATNHYAQRGIEVHDVLNKFFDYDFRQINSETPKNEFETIVKNLAGENYEKYQKYYDNFVMFEVPQWDNTKKDESIMPMYREVKIEINGLSGIIDRVDKLPNGEYIVIDYKTEQIKIKNEEKALKKFDLELAMYAVMANQYLKLDVQKVGVLCLDDGRLLTKEITEKEITEAFTIIDYVKRQVENKCFDKPEKPDCYFCGFKTACKGGKVDVGTNE